MGAPAPESNTPAKERGRISQFTDATEAPTKGESIDSSSDEIERGRGVMAHGCPRDEAKHTKRDHNGTPPPRNRPTIAHAAQPVTSMG